MKYFYVVGNKTSKSLSPVIFNYWFSKYKINARYGFIETTSKGFEKKIKKTLNKKNLIGLNITIPFKQKIMGYIDSLDKHAKKIDAVNCVSLGKKTEGINTDWVGFFKAIPKVHSFKNKKILIIGYGGAALGIHYVLKTKGFKNIFIVNRTKKRLGFENQRKFTLSLNNLNIYLKKADLIINTTPTNPINKKQAQLVKTKALINDIVYIPKETGFLKNFPNHKKIYGISMLLEQAKPCFKTWFGFDPIIDTKLIKILEKKTK
tara:strand:- start:21048 stop:21833 length:786 start_codon:yes stop_codon:yes gene_type:complete